MIYSIIYEYIIYISVIMAGGLMVLQGGDSSYVFIAVFPQYYFDY